MYLIISLICLDVGLKGYCLNCYRMYAFDGGMVRADTGLLEQLMYP